MSLLCWFPALKTRERDKRRGGEIGLARHVDQGESGVREENLLAVEEDLGVWTERLLEELLQDLSIKQMKLLEVRQIPLIQIVKEALSPKNGGGIVSKSVVWNQRNSD